MLSAATPRASTVTDPLDPVLCPVLAVLFGGDGDLPGVWQFPPDWSTSYDPLEDSTWVMWVEPGISTG